MKNSVCMTLQLPTSLIRCLLVSGKSIWLCASRFCSSAATGRSCTRSMDFITSVLEFPHRKPPWTFPNSSHPSPILPFRSTSKTISCDNGIPRRTPSGLSQNTIFSVSLQRGCGAEALIKWVRAGARVYPWYGSPYALPQKSREAPV